MNNIYNRLLSVLESDFVVERNEVNKGMDLRKDLGITGQDALNLFVEIEKIFKIDLSDFPISDYFEGEGFSFFNWKKKFKKLSLGDLEQEISCRLES